MSECEKLVPLGYIVVQSMPLTEKEGEIWLTMIARTMPPEIVSLFTQSAWVPIIPGDLN